MNPPPARNLLNASELLDIQYTTASRGKRLINYLLDVVIYTASFFTIVVVWSLFSSIFEEESTVFNLVYYSGYFLYYTLFEGILGKTPGKMITNTRVINEEGEPVSLWQALGRSFSRLIPFDALTFIRHERPRGLHDRLSGTWVIDDVKPGLYQQHAGQTRFEISDE